MLNCKDRKEFTGHALHFQQEPLIWEKHAQLAVVRSTYMKRLRHMNTGLYLMKANSDHRIQALGSSFAIGNTI